MEYFDKFAVYCHCNAYDDTIKCLYKSTLKNGYCHLHQEHVGNINKFMEIDDAHCVVMIKLDTDKNRVIFGSENKKRNIIELYEFLIHCPRFMCKYERFTNTVFDKMIELGKQGLNLDYYLEQLFPYYKK
jgi:hypothetical protein